MNPDRYSNIAIKRLLDNGFVVCAVGNKNGEVLGVKIYNSRELFQNIHTITLYLSAKNQENYYHYILSLKPQRVIFNPGTENEILEGLLTKSNIKFEYSCTLVLLSIGGY